MIVPAHDEQQNVRASTGARAPCLTRPPGVDRRIFFINYSSTDGTLEQARRVVRRLSSVVGAEAEEGGSTGQEMSGGLTSNSISRILNVQGLMSGSNRNWSSVSWTRIVRVSSSTFGSSRKRAVRSYSTKG